MERILIGNPDDPDGDGNAYVEFFEDAVDGEGFSLNVNGIRGHRASMAIRVHELTELRAALTTWVYEIDKYIEKKKRGE